MLKKKQKNMVALLDGRVWPAEVGLSLAIGGGVSAESLDVLTEKTSEFLIHSFHVLQLPRASQKQFW